MRLYLVGNAADEDQHLVLSLTSHAVNEGPDGRNKYLPLLASRASSYHPLALLVSQTAYISYVKLINVLGSLKESIFLIRPFTSRLVAAPPTT